MTWAEAFGYGAMSWAAAAVLIVAIVCFAMTKDS